jgi:glycosyltransferase involved in cell wall biosynthesis
MRVALVSEHANPLVSPGAPEAGGQNVHVAALAGGLVRLGAEVTVYTRRAAPTPPARVRLGGGGTVEFVDAGPARHVPRDDLLPHMRAFAAGLASRWAARPPDVVHAHFWMSGVASAAAAGPLTIPVVQTFHALGNVKRRFHPHVGGLSERVSAETRLAVDVAAIVATSRAELRELTSLGARPRLSRVIPCGVDTEVFQPAGPAEPRRRPRLLTVSRLVERKGVGDAVRALARLPGAELVVAGGESGSDPGIAALRALADRLGVADRVEFRGPVRHPDLAALMRSADVFIAVPWYEPFGIAPLEAMACGVPVIVSAVGGLVETVADGRCGLMVAPRDPAALATAVVRLLDDARLRRDLAEAGRARAVRYYRWDQIAHRTATLYQRVVSQSWTVTSHPDLPAGQ